MKDVIESIKSIYKGENQLERHLWYVVLMILPAITGAMISFIDKDTPKEILPAVIICSIIFGIISIIPFVYLVGIYFQYIKNRMNGETGLPQMNNGLFMTGLKALPLVICWLLYIAMISFAGFIVVSLSLIAATAFSKLLMLLLIVPIIVLVTIALSICYSLLMVFVNYIYIQYSEDFKLKGELFNPFLICKYIKDTFKDTFITACKYLLAAIVVHFCACVVLIILGILLFVAWVLAKIFIGNFNIQTSTFITLLITSVITLAGSYISGILGFGLLNKLVEIYKNTKSTDA